MAERGYYRAGAGIALATPLLIVWTTIVRDDGQGIGPLMLVLAAAVGAFAALLRAPGMARAMLGVAVMQVLLGALVATAPSTIEKDGGVWRTLIFNGAFALCWLGAAACFRWAALVAKRPRG